MSDAVIEDFEIRLKKMEIESANISGKLDILLALNAAVIVLSVIIG